MTLLLENLAWRHAFPLFLHACLSTPEYVLKACLLMYTVVDSGHLRLHSIPKKLRGDCC